jgi:hypothetical protein
VVHDREGFHWDGDGFWRRAVFDLDGIHHQSLSSRHNYFAVDAWDVERLGFGAALEVKRKEAVTPRLKAVLAFSYRRIASQVCGAVKVQVRLRKVGASSEILISSRPHGLECEVGNVPVALPALV